MGAGSQETPEDMAAYIYMLVSILPVNLQICK